MAERRTVPRGSDRTAEEGGGKEGRVAHPNPISVMELGHALALAGFTVERITTNWSLKRRSLPYRLLAAVIKARGGSQASRPRQADVRQHLLEESLLFGEILVVKA